MLNNVANKQKNSINLVFLQINIYTYSDGTPVNQLAFENSEDDLTEIENKIKDIQTEFRGNQDVGRGKKLLFLVYVLLLIVVDISSILKLMMTST